VAGAVFLDPPCRRVVAASRLFIDINVSPVILSFSDSQKSTAYNRSVSQADFTLKAMHDARVMTISAV